MSRTRAQLNVGQVPLHFEANQGQTSAEVKYMSRGPGYALFLTAAESVFTFRRRGAVDDVPAESAVLRAHLVGAHPHAELVAFEPLAGKVNYFIGNSPDQWRTGVPTYAKVRARDVYPGIDVVYYGNQQQLEHDFVVAPDADAGQIRLAFDGQAGALRIDEHGNLIVPLVDGELVERQPVIYQETASGREPVAGNYVLRSAGERQEVGFEVVAYDRSRPLVIDPILVFSTYLGGTGSQNVGGDFGHGVAVDVNGSVYLAGSTNSTDFPTQSPLQPAPGGSTEGYVTKFTPDGNALVYSTYLGGSSGDIPRDIAVDGAGNAYVTGHTNSADFPTVNPYQATFSGVKNAFVTKLSAAGSGLVYSTFLGVSADLGNRIAVDGAGSAYVVGETSSGSFPTLNAYQAVYGGMTDVFVTKFTPAGNALAYSTFLGGAAGETAAGIVVDGSGSAYVTGHTLSANFPTQSPYQGALNGIGDAFVTKLAPAGNTVTYSTYLGGSGGDSSRGIAIDGSGSAYVAGWTASPDFPTQNPYASSPDLGAPTCGTPPCGDAFVAKLTPAGTGLTYATYLGGSGYDEANVIALDATGAVYVGGYTQSANFPTQAPYQGAYGGGSTDGFVTKLTAAGSALVYSTYLGGSDNDFVRGLDVSPAPVTDTSVVAVYVGGMTGSNNFPTQAPYQATRAGVDQNAFAMKIAAGNEQVQQAVLPGGTVTTDTEIDGATPADPFETSVTSPNAGTITIVEAAVSLSPPHFQIDITAPAATAASPLVVTFRIDATVVLPLFNVLRNFSGLLPACSGAPGTASPDPCIESQTFLGDGDLLITVHTSKASLWTVADPSIPTTTTTTSTTETTFTTTTSTTTTTLPSGPCGLAPVGGCQGASKASLRLVTNVTTPKRNKLAWKWRSSATVGLVDLGVPTSTTGYVLCVYDTGGYQFSAQVSAGGTCNGKPCWKASSKGFKYADRLASTDGLKKVQLKSGDAGRAKINVGGKGINLPAFGLPLSAPVTVQLRRDDSPICWEATYATPSLSGSSYKAKTP